MATLSEYLLEILVCPVTTCHGPLAGCADKLICQRCGLQYRIEEHWPVLIPEEAEPQQES